MTIENYKLKLLNDARKLVDLHIWEEQPEKIGGGKLPEVIIQKEPIMKQWAERKVEIANSYEKLSKAYNNYIKRKKEMDEITLKQCQKTLKQN
jgi:hypothetical protein